MQSVYSAFFVYICTLKRSTHTPEGTFSFINPNIFPLIVENFCQLDACSKNMSIKKLLKEGITYNSLITIFEECCSFLDFYETMKTYGIERKVAKVMALHFSGKGLHNQGAKSYSKMSPMLISFDSKLETSKDQPSGNRPLRGEDADSKAEPKADSNRSSICQHVSSGQEQELSSAKKQLDCKPKAEGKEDWEDEATKAGPRKSFTLKCTTATPLSLEIDDFSSTQPKKGGGRNTNEKLRTPQSYSETNGSCTSDGNYRRQEVRAEESRGATRRSNLRKWTRRKRRGQGKTELGLKKDSVNSEKERPAKPTALSQESLSGGNGNGQLAGAISLSEHDVNKDEAERLACDEIDLPSVCKPAKKEGTSPSWSSICDKSDRSASKSVEELAIVMIGDISISVPVVPWEQEYSNPRDLAQSEMFSSEPDQTEDKSVAKNETQMSSRLESSLPPKKIDQAQSEPLARGLQSAHGDSGTPFQEENEEFNDVKSINVVENSKDDECAPEKVVEEEDSPEMAPSVENQVVSECQDVTKTNDPIADTVEAMRSDNSHTVADHTSELVDLRKPVEVEGGELIGAGYDMSGLFQHSMQQGLNPSSGPANEATGNVNISWHKLQAPVQEAALMAERFVVSEGLPCHGVDTDEVENTRLDLQAELSSESSSTSGEPMDGFYRQPPLGAERGFTPDTVQPRPDQMAWEGSVNEGMFPTPSASSVPGVSFNYPQGALQSYGNPYAVYHQPQQLMHPLKPYHSSFVYPLQIPHVISHPVVQAQPQVVWSPYQQYRSQVMFSNTLPQVTGFPTAVTPASPFRPQIYQVWNGAARFPCSTVPFYGNQCHQMQEESTYGMLDGGCAHQSIGVPQVKTSEEYQIPVIMNLSGTAGSEVRQEPGLETRSVASTPSPFEPITVPLSSNIIYSAHEPTSSFNRELTGTHVVDSLVEDHHLIAEQKARGNQTHRDADNCTDSILEQAQPCEQGIAHSEPHESEHVDIYSYSSKEISIDSFPREGEADLPKQHIILLSREENATSMEKRLSPDGSSMEGVSCDSSSYHNAKGPSKENNEELVKRDSKRWQDGSSVQQVCATGIPPTPQGVKEVSGQNSKHIQDRLLVDNEQPKIVASNVPKIAESAASKILCDANDYAGQPSSVAVDKKKTVHRVLTSRNQRASKRVAAIEKCEATIASDENVKSIVTSSQSTCGADDVASLGVKKRFGNRRQEIFSQRPVRNRGFNHRAWRPYSRKQL